MCQSARVSIANLMTDVCFFTVTMFMPLHRAHIWHLHTKFYKFEATLLGITRQWKTAQTRFLPRLSTCSNHVSYSRLLALFVEWLWFLVLITWLVKTENTPNAVILQSDWLSHNYTLAITHKCTVGWSFLLLRKTKHISKRPHDTGW